jgi:S1-C subfamily serine protease
MPPAGPGAIPSVARAERWVPAADWPSAFQSKAQHEPAYGSGHPMRPILTGTRMSATLRRAGPDESWGLGVGFVDDAVVVTTIIPGSPIDRCGAISVMDRIITINGVPVHRNAPLLVGELFAVNTTSAVIEFDFVFH